jgi:iron complex outermembrane receptor protein
VEVVSDKAFKNGPAQTMKDVLGWETGVFAQSRYGDDARVSIRVSGLSRNYWNRGINAYMDGVPINTSDGLVDLFEVDPTPTAMWKCSRGQMPCATARIPWEVQSIL